MRALIKSESSPGVEYTNIPEPIPKDDEIVIQVKAAAICGTDVSLWRWNSAGESFAKKYGAKPPFVLGHECCGVITDKGSKVSNLEIGDHVSLETHISCGQCFQCKTGEAHNCQNLKIYGVSCNGCFAEYAAAPASCAFKLPESISFEEGALFEPAGVAMFGVQESSLKPGDVVMIYGCGPIGQIAIQLMLASGASSVIAVDIDDYKVDMATQLGAIAVNSLKQDIGEVVSRYTADRGGVDIIMEISGASTIYDTMFDYLRPEGHVVLLAHPGEPVMFDIMKMMHHKGVTIKGVFGRRIWDSWYALTRMVESGRIDLSRVITHRFPLSAGNAAFEKISEGAGKIIFLPELQ